ncbi:MAG: translation initiation factor IF-3 [Candidatus Colwellbacteria bacterium]|nr:translation initiation factor IF-3 [Candidatus Colwellbacteria bacterium]
MIDEQGQNIGVVPLEEAKSIAESRGLDLILIVPNATPPVARIQSFDKFRYEKQKELKKQRRAVKIQELKQIQISPKEAKNDLAYKLKRLEEFLNEGNKVVIVMVLRGREKSMQDFARGKLAEFLALITTPYKINQEVKFAGRGLAMQIEKQ